MALVGKVAAYLTLPSLHARVSVASTLYTLIQPDLRLFIYGKVHPSVADDVLQETLIAIFTNLAKFRGDTDKQFLAWCYQIARNKANDQLRKQSAQRIQPLAEEEFWHYVEKSSLITPFSPEDKMDCQYAMDLLAKLKPGCRDALWQRFVVRLKLREIAEGLNLDTDTIRMRIKRCLILARKLLEE